MSNIFPYISENKCLMCGSDLIITCKRLKKFCSNKCRVGSLKKSKEENKKIKNCNKCGAPYTQIKKTQKYCSKVCFYETKKRDYDRICENCGKKFSAHNIGQIKRGNHKFCSLECSRRKHNYIEYDFNQQTAISMYWLGFLFAATYDFEKEFMTIVDTKFMLDKLSLFLKSDVPIRTKSNLYTLTLSSRTYMRHLSLVGIRSDFYKEAPLIENLFVKDFIRGYFDSHKGFIYKDGNRNVVAIHSEDSKLMRYFADMLDAKLAYKNKEWIVVCRDFEVSCNGLPKNEKKWKKFMTSPKSF